jgi:hypothetical protein
LRAHLEVERQLVVDGLGDLRAAEDETERSAHRYAMADDVIASARETARAYRSQLVTSERSWRRPLVLNE